MKSRIPPILTALLVACVPAAAQQPAAPAPAAAAPAPAGSKAFSQQELDELLAPIALYPDALLAQVLMASTYPLEIVEAARWSKANPGVKDKALEEAMQKQSWDPAVKALTAVPQVLTMMNEKLDWTQKLGDAFLAQQADIMTTTQALRAKAQAAGNLKSTPEQTVKTEKQADKTVYIIEPAKPEVVYVPTYNPATIYGTWWYSYPPPYYYYPPGYGYGAGLAFATGVVVGAAIWGNCNWGGNNVNVNVNKYNNFNKTNIQNGNFQHNAEHRKGVSYKDNATAQKYGRGTDAKAAQSREQFRGQAEQGRAQMQTMDKSQLQGRAQDATRAGTADRAGAGGGAQSRAGGSGGGQAAA
ncbi:MAG: DUF3300 domain-containing protein, partial [Betaproteobacteria bacterium]|nr:DUF3300 domain-containing protein [Betaproteobacteria bacterium]